MKRFRSIVRFLSYVFYGMISGIIIAVFALVILSKNQILPPMRALVVLSGSMDPAIKLGSVVLVESQDAYREGDIITFTSNGNKKQLISHRIAGIQTENNKIIYTTKGDANEEKDRAIVNESNVIGKVTRILPYLGYAVEKVKDPKGFILLVIVPATIVIYEELKKIIGELRAFIKRKKKKIQESEKPMVSGTSFVMPTAVAVIPIIATFFVYTGLVSAYLSDSEQSAANSVSVATSFGEPTSNIFLSNGFTCPGGASDTSSPFGNVGLTSDETTLTFSIILTGAQQDSVYDIWVNQDPGGCPQSSPTAPSSLTTDSSGNGSATIPTDRVGSASVAWISAVSGTYVLRSSGLAL